MKNECKKEQIIGYTSVDRHLNLSLIGCASLIQDMVTELFEQIESDNPRLKEESKAAWVLAKQKIHFTKYPVWHQKIQATSFIANKSKIMVENNIKIEDENGNILVVAKQKSCPIDLETRKLRKIETIKFPLGLELKEAIMENSFEELNTIFQKEDIIGTREVYSIDTDYTHHTNNISYVRFIMNMLNSKFFDTNMIIDFEINYIHESVEGQMLDIYRKDDENSINFLIKFEKNELVRARIKYKKQ